MRHAGKHERVKTYSKQKHIISLLLVVAMILSMFPAVSNEIGTYAAGDSEDEIRNDVGITAYDESSVYYKEIIDGIRYKYSIDTSNDTAKLQEIKNVDGSKDTTPTRELTFPGSFTVDDTSFPAYHEKTYTVTSMGFSMVWGSSYVYDIHPDVTSVVFPESVKEVGGNFNMFPNVKEFVINGTVEKFSGSFQNCHQLEKITFEEGVKEINSNNMVSNLSKLTAIELPNSLELISSAGTFAGAKGLKSITLPDGVQVNDTTSMFDGCSALESIELPSSIVKIGSEMFANCLKLQSVEAGQLTTIGRYAFSGCDKLETISDLSNVEKIEEYAFGGCTNLTGTIDLSSVKDTVGAYAFYDTKITGVTLGDNIKVIDDGAFLRTKLTSVALPAGLSKIGQSAFNGTGLTSVSLPEGLSQIGKSAFRNAPITGTVEVPDSVTNVGEYAFSGTEVEEFNVGSGLKEIPAGAFSSSKLKKISINGSKDEMAVTTGLEGLPAGTVVEYKFESVGDVGNKISDDAGAKTLQEAIDQASEGEVIKISKHVKVSEKLVVPAGKNITISSDDANIIMAEDGKNVGDLFDISEGAEVTFGGNLVLSGRYNSKSVIRNAGEITVKENVVVKGSNIKKENNDIGVIHNTGENASIVINGGKITQNSVAGQRSGIVYVGQGASVSITGGEISGNSVNDYNAFNSSSGVFLTDGGHGEMTGGLVEKNKAIRGSGIMLYSIDPHDKVLFKMSGGKVSNNTYRDGYLTPSGAVHVEGKAEFTMTGGEISNNKGVQGAGVCVLDYGLQQIPEKRDGTAFTLDGGKILENEGNSGAGIYTYANGTRLLSGEIRGNKADSLGGGVYCEGNETHYGSMYVERALITGNTADQGGGIWFCPTGSGEINAQNGAAVFENTANDVGDDFVAAGNAIGLTITLSEEMMGGGKMRIYKDGAVSRLGTNFLPAVRSDVPRYGKPGAEDTLQKVENSLAPIAMKAIASDWAKAAARSQAKLFIIDNTAGYGGGIGTNGGVKIGTVPPPEEYVTDIAVKKVWVHNGMPEAKRPDSIMIKLINSATKEELEAVILTTTSGIIDKDGNWNYTFKDLPQRDETGEEIEYSVVEEAVPGYSTIIKSEQGMFVITNTYKPPTTPPTPPDKPETPPEEPPETPPEKPETPPEEPETPPEEPEVPERPTLPDPNDPNSPPTVTIEEGGVPRTYKKVPKDDGTFEYLPEDEIPLIAKTDSGDWMNLWLILMMFTSMALVMTGICERRASRRKS